MENYELVLTQEAFNELQTYESNIELAGLGLEQLHSLEESLRSISLEGEIDPKATILLNHAYDSILQSNFGYTPSIEEYFDINKTTTSLALESIFAKGKEIVSKAILYLRDFVFKTLNFLYSFISPTRALIRRCENNNKVLSRYSLGIYEELDRYWDDKYLINPTRKSDDEIRFFSSNSSGYTRNKFGPGLGFGESLTALYQITSKLSKKDLENDIIEVIENFKTDMKSLQKRNELEESGKGLKIDRKLNLITRFFTTTVSERLAYIKKIFKDKQGEVYYLEPVLPGGFIFAARIDQGNYISKSIRRPDIEFRLIDTKGVERNSIAVSDRGKFSQFMPSSGTMIQSLNSLTKKVLEKSLKAQEVSKGVAKRIQSLLDDTHKASLASSQRSDGLFSSLFRLVRGLTLSFTSPFSKLFNFINKCCLRIIKINEEGLKIIKATKMTAADFYEEVKDRYPILLPFIDKNTGTVSKMGSMALGVIIYLIIRGTLYIKGINLDIIKQKTGFPPDFDPDNIPGGGFKPPPYSYEPENIPLEEILKNLGLRPGTPEEIARDGLGPDFGKSIKNLSSSLWDSLFPNGLNVSDMVIMDGIV